jgi:hypothetical protein
MKIRITLVVKTLVLLCFASTFFSASSFAVPPPATFTGNVSPSYQSIVVGQSATYVINVIPVGGFTSDVTLSVTGVPSGATASFSPSNVVTGGSGTAALTITTTAAITPGPYNMTLTGTSGSFYLSTQLGLGVNSSVGDFSGSISQNPINAVVGTTGNNITIDITPVGGFTGNVTLSVSNLPAGVSGSFLPSFISGGSGTAKLSLNLSPAAVAGQYSIQITGTSDALVHTATVGLHISSSASGDFTGGATPSFAMTAPGGSVSYTISVSPLFGQNGDVALSVSNLPPGVTPSFSPSNLIINETGTVVLTLQTSSTTPVGFSNFVLTGQNQNGGFVHNLGIGLNVSLFTGAFTTTASPNPRPGNATTTLLNDGTVLIAGGDEVPSTTATEELYDPTTETFTPTGPLNHARYRHTATLLTDGKVVIAGGVWFGGYVATAELYNPATGTFTPTGNLNTGRVYHTATLLNNGLILIAGGGLASAELYNPATGIFTPTGSMNTARQGATATLLIDGTVLIAGGGFGSFGGVLASAELYNPATGIFTPTGSMNTARQDATATLLNDGTVLIAGGGVRYGNVVSFASAELYSPATGTFTPTGSLNFARQGATAALLNNGKALIAGGDCVCPAALTSSAELYDSATGTFVLTGSMNYTRYEPRATLLNNGKVLVAGSYGANGDPAELFTPATFTPSNLVSISVTAATFTLSPGTSQQFVATGTYSDSSTQQLASVTWTSSNNTVATITNDASNRGAAYAVAPGSTTIQACAGTVCASAVLIVNAP